MKVRRLSVKEQSQVILWAQTNLAKVQNNSIVSIHKSLSKDIPELSDISHTSIRSVLKALNIPFRNENRGGLERYNEFRTQITQLDNRVKTLEAQVNELLEVMK
jgi:hypothetical protein